MKRRWRLETWDAAKQQWVDEATWHDGNNARGTPRFERAIKEGRDFVDSGTAARVLDLHNGNVHTIGRSW